MNLINNGFLYYIEDYNIENNNKNNNNNAFQLMFDFIRFFNDSIIILRFINNQPKKLGMKIIPLNRVICSLIIARKVRFFVGFNENEYLN